GLFELDESVRADLRDGWVARSEHGEAGDGPWGAVGQVGYDRGLLPPGRGPQGAHSRQGFRLLYPPLPLRGSGRPLRDPPGNHLGRDSVSAEPGPPFVGDAAEGFLEHQARAGVLFISTAAPDVAGELDVVLSWVESAKAQPESVLAARRAVARAGVASAHVESGDHVLAEADATRLVEPRHHDRDLRFLPADLDCDLRVAVPLAAEEAPGRIEEVRGGGSKVGKGGQVADGAVGIFAGNNDLLHGSRSI